MTNYITSDFSVIHSPEVIPHLPGWYVTQVYHVGAIEKYRDPKKILLMNFTYWNGEAWYSINPQFDIDSLSKIPNQKRYWFGLNQSF